MFTLSDLVLLVKEGSLSWDSLDGGKLRDNEKESCVICGAERAEEIPVKGGFARSGRGRETVLDGLLTLCSTVGISVQYAVGSTEGFAVDI